MDSIRGEKSSMSTLPVETLELLALEERNRLHQTASELRSKIAAVRQKMDLANTARQHIREAGLIAAILGLASGYGFAGIFTRR